MNPISPKMKLSLGRKALLVVAAGALVGGMSRLAPAVPSMGATPSAVKGEGLDGLDDRYEHILGAELSSRGIGNLLDYYFKSKNVPESEKEAIKSAGALSELSKAGSPIPYPEKIRRTREVADGIDAVLPTMKDPTQLMATAVTMIEFGVNQDVNSLEYWGEDPVTQAHLKPLSSAMLKLFTAAAKIAEKRAAEMANDPALNSSPAKIEAWEKMDKLAHDAEYTRLMSTYFDCIATSPKVFIDPKTKAVLTPQEAEQKAANKEKMASLRKTMADAAITSLKEFDNPDNGVQPRIRLMIAKLYMAAGEYTSAKNQFFTVYSDKSDSVPPANPFEQSEARYFAVVTQLISGDLAAATADKKTLDTWQTTTFPTLLKPLKNDKGEAIFDDAAIKKTVDSLTAASDMLQYRIWVLTGDLAPTPAAKAAADSSADAVLLALKASHPELAARIDQQLVNRFPANGVVNNTVASSVLLALVKKGMVESYKADPDKPDAVIVKRAITAAQVIIDNKDRKSAKGTIEFTPQNISDSKLAIAELQESLNNDVEAAKAYLAFSIEERNTDKKKSEEAFDRAGFLIFNKMAKTKPLGYEEVYAKFLPIAIDPPYNRTNLAPLYADQLKDRKEYQLAIKYYRMVPKDSPAYALVDYKIMLMLNGMLDPENLKNLDEATRKKTVAELRQAAAQVKAVNENPKDNFERNRAIAATLILADLARQDKDADQMLAVLAGFDQLVDGLTADGKPKEVQEALAKKKLDWKRGAKSLVVRAMMQRGKIEQAVQEVIKLISGGADADGVLLVRDLIDILDKDYDTAKAKNPPDTAGMHEARKNEAQLTHYLVDFSNPAKGQTNPKIAAAFYAYSGYDAHMLREAGLLAEDPAEKKALFIKARDAYQTLASPPMKALYLAQGDVKEDIKNGKRDAADPDPAVAANLALTTFDLGDYKTSHEMLLPLVQQKKFGPLYIPEKDAHGDPKVDANGMVVTKVNKVYWEGMYDYLKSGQEIYKSDPTALAVIITDLKNLLIRGGIPPEFAPQYEDLRKALCPEFNPNVAPVPAAPTTKPAVPATPVTVAPAKAK